EEQWTTVVPQCLARALAVAEDGTTAMLARTTLAPGTLEGELDTSAETAEFVMVLNASGDVEWSLRDLSYGAAVAFGADGSVFMAGHEYVPSTGYGNTDQVPHGILHKLDGK